MKRAASTQPQHSVGSRIITVVLVLCVGLLMSGLIVQSQLMSSQVQFYQTALEYCYQTDCSALNQAQAKEEGNQ